MTLTDLAEKWCVDKLHSHSYIPVYEELFRTRQIRRMLEIGIGFEELMTPFVPRYIHGASLKMWEEFLPDAEIFACDIREDTMINQGRIRSMLCDQSSGQSLAEMVFEFSEGLQKGFDCIIDDGSHKTKDQIFTAECLLPRLNVGGVYVIEDVQDPDAIMLALMPVVRRWPINRNNLTLECVEEPLAVHAFDKRPDDCMVVIQK